jgi:spore coat polysaccharide biosynthesis predicted glycosyltransferase SpsG
LAAGRARDVVVFLGATDAQKLTMPLVSQLRSCVEPERIVVLVGALNEDRPAVEAWCQAEGIRCRAGVEDVAAMLETCRVLVAACGMTAVEAQAIGIPCLLIPLSPIQRTVALWFAAQKRAVVLEPTECATPASVAAAWYETLELSPSSAEERPISVRGAAHVVDLLLEPRP